MPTTRTYEPKCKKPLPSTTSNKLMSPDKLASIIPLSHSGFKALSKGITSTFREI